MKNKFVNQVLITLTICFSTPYLLISFVLLNANPITWTENQRFEYIMVASVVAVVVIIILAARTEGENDDSYPY